MSIKKVSNFRNKFVLKQNVKNWFPGHMVKGEKTINKKLKDIDCLIEIHDARVPLTGRSSNFQKSLSLSRPHILILNKVDVSDTKLNDVITDKLKHEDNITEVFFTSLKYQSSIKKILNLAMKLVKDSDRYKRSDNLDINLMVTGIPNVGKSTFINKILSQFSNRKKVAKVGPLPGVTRAVQEKIKISNSPLTYIYDTPGVLRPSFKNECEEPLKLTSLGILPDYVIGPEIVSDYILYWLNKHSYFDYAQVLDIGEPVDDVNELLVKICIKNNFFLGKKDFQTKQIVKKPNLYLASKIFNSMFCEAKYGKYMLDQDVL